MAKPISFFFAFLIMMCSPISVDARNNGQNPLQGLGDLLNGLGGKGAANQDSTSVSSGTNSGGLSDLLSGVAGALGLGNGKADIKSLAGTWTYKSPAVSFKSDNLLLKAGGAAAAERVEKKLEPYYRTAGLTDLTITINTDSTFVFKGRRATLSGTMALDDESGVYEFRFKAFKTINIGSMEAYISLNGKNAMSLTFDVSKLMTIIQKISALSNNSTLKGASALLDRYDGLTAGFDLTRR